MSRLAGFNSLPAKQEYIDLVVLKLKNNSFTLTEIISKTKLTKTQVACTIDELISRKIIQINLDSKKRKVYSIEEDV